MSDSLVSYANNDVKKFYQKLPFNYYGDSSNAAEGIRQTNAILYYPVLPPLFQEGINIADIGCGAGWFVNSVNFHYTNCKALGIDYNHVATDQAKEVASILDINSEFLTLDFFKHIPETKFDLVSSIGVLHHTDNCIEGIRHLFRHFIDKGGHAFIGLYHEHGRKPFLDHFENLKASKNEQELLEEYKSLHFGNNDNTFNLSWFYDQVLHPHETQHTLKELMPLLKEENMELVSTSINKFEPITDETQLFEEEEKYYSIACDKLKNKEYFPGFFVFLAKKIA